MRTLPETAAPEPQGDLPPAGDDGFADLHEACLRAAEVYEMDPERIVRGLALCLVRALRIEQLRSEYDVRRR